MCANAVCIGHCKANSIVCVSHYRYYTSASQEVAESLMRILERNDPEDLSLIEEALAATKGYRHELVTSSWQVLQHAFVRLQETVFFCCSHFTCALRRFVQAKVSLVVCVHSELYNCNIAVASSVEHVRLTVERCAVGCAAAVGAPGPPAFHPAHRGPR